ncbi:GNAT family N-acetyltransferase [Proteiniclasticum sp.]|uniref:GNAT family N-acetyltransferase n=1 Tax=Proteiniclasticum sp. TaxID=2053595 RepID=UPI00289DD97D|nr:GNAT family N-acetyltransferase [Proteiniclasticum sp.]
MFEVKEIPPEMTYPIRHKVLRPHQDLNECVYDTDFMDGTFHAGVFHDEELICIASFNPENHPSFSSGRQYHLRAMATLPSFRNMGVGRTLISYAEERLKSDGTEIIWCNGRTEVKGYYEKSGFKSYGEVFDYPGLGPHIVMYKELK